ncbi:MAG: extracellular solute-binding protein [Candidatus Rokubacteria bacterium]|nr:extracellular solute-binding protein [Candidatus Rokubacteria bacterium]
MTRFRLSAFALSLLVLVVAVGLFAAGAPAQGKKPYEGTTIRAIVNAEYVKYSLSLVEKDLLDKLGIKIETEVIPIDAFVAKTLLEFNSGKSPWDLVMFGPSNMPDYGRHFEPLEQWISKLKLDFQMDDIPDVYKKLMLRHQGKIVSMPYDGDIHIMFWNKVAFERPDNKKKFKAKHGYDLAAPKTWKQWDDQAAFFHGWGWDGTDRKLFGAGASYKPSGSGYSYHWWRARFFSYGGQYFDADMKPLINGPAAVRALEEIVKTMPYYPPGVLLFESEEPKTMLIKGEVPMLYSWTSTGKRVGNPAESLIIGKAGFGLVPGAEIDGKIVNRPSLTPGRAMAVSIYSQKKEATMKVLEFISNPDQSLKIVMDAKTIMDPWRNSHFKATAFRKAFPGADEYLDAILKSFPYVVPDPIIPGANEYQRKLSFEITEALAGRKPVKAALDTAAAEWEKITDRRGRDKQKALWGEKMGEMKQVGIEYHPDWAQKAK